MRKNLKVALVNYKGELITDDKGNNQLMCDIIGVQLFAAGGKQSLTSDEKLQAYRLCTRLQVSPEDVELSAEDVTLIKKVVNDSYVAGIYGQIVDWLEK